MAFSATDAATAQPVDSVHPPAEDADSHMDGGEASLITDSEEREQRDIDDSQRDARSPSMVIPDSDDDLFFPSTSRHCKELPLVSPVTARTLARPLLSPNGTSPLMSGPG